MISNAELSIYDYNNVLLIEYLFYNSVQHTVISNIALTTITDRLGRVIDLVSYYKTVYNKALSRLNEGKQTQIILY